MGILSVDLHDSENVVLKIRQHWVLLLWPTAKFVIGAIVGVFVVKYANILFDEYLDSYLSTLLYLAWLMIFFNFWFHGFMGWYLNYYMVTDQRIINVTHKSYFERRLTETSFHKIQDVTHETLGFYSMLFNFGNVVIQTAGHQTLIHFRMVPNPKKIHTKIASLISKQHIQKAAVASVSKTPSFMQNEL